MKQKEIQKLGKTLLWWNQGHSDAGTPYEDTCSMCSTWRASTALWGAGHTDHGMSEPFVLGSGMHFGQASTPRGEQKVVWWDEMIQERPGKAEKVSI